MSSKLKPFINMGPGQIIKRNLTALNWTNKDLAEIIDMSEKSVSQLINNKQAITVDTAFLLGKAFDTSPEFWLNLEQNYRLRNQIEGKKEQDAQIKAEIRKYMPILEMRKIGWIDFDKSVESQKQAFCNFWRIKSLDYSMYTIQDNQFYARQGKIDENYTKYYSITWFKKAKNEAKSINVPFYNEAKLKGIVNNIKRYISSDDGISKFIEDISDCGVKFFVLSHLSKTYLDGAAFIDNANPVIVYTGRHDRIDNFWWTIIHEIGHILLHIKNGDEYFIDNFDEKPDGDIEKEADAFARSVLDVDKIVQTAKPYAKYMTESKLLELSKEAKLSPQMVLGILQFSKLVDYRTLSKYRLKVVEIIDKEYIKP